MTIRTKLTLYTTAFFALGLGVLIYSLVSLEKSYLMSQNKERTALVETTLRRQARDAMLQKDDILLLSYVRFMRQEFRALGYVNVTWAEKGRSRTHSIGSVSSSQDTEKRVCVEKDPQDPSRFVELELGIDRRVLAAGIDERVSSLERRLLRFYLLIMAVCLLFSHWLAGTLTRPLSDLSRAAGEIAQGNLGMRLEWSSSDEIGALVSGFNHMSQRLEELDAMKRDFVSAVTHELRSPLGAMESFINLIESKMVGGRHPDPAQFQDYFGRIKVNVRRLSGFISDLLDVAKIERGKMECTLRPTSLQGVAGEVVQFFEAKSREQGVTLSSRVDPAFAQVQADPERLRQVLVNLISNALKFTPKGGAVWVSAEQYREDGQRFAEVSVFDTGKGMDSADLAAIFKKFSQGKNANAVSSGPRGTGLGLFIVKSIVEAHGGKVGVKSDPGKGTQFLFNLRMS